MDAVTAAGRVPSLPYLSLDPAFRRGHGMVYQGLAQGHAGSRAYIFPAFEAPPALLTRKDDHDQAQECLRTAEVRARVTLVSHSI